MNSEKYLQKVTIGKIEENPEIVLEKYNPNWVKNYKKEEEKIKQALGEKALLIEHVGSTAVSGLTAKPILDILLVVKDSSKESAYLPNLIAVGYQLRIREPEWYQHRMFKGFQPQVNLHVFSQNCEEAEQMLLFRNWLRLNDTDRSKYQQVKEKLSKQKWPNIQAYADAKTLIVQEIKANANQFFNSKN